LKRRSGTLSRKKGGWNPVYHGVVKLGRRKRRVLPSHREDRRGTLGRRKTLNFFPQLRVDSRVVHFSVCTGSTKGC